MARKDGIKWYPAEGDEKVKRPKSIINEPSCRFSRAAIWASGRHGLMWFYCEDWSCDTCKRRFIAEMCTKILALSGDAEMLYTVAVRLKKSAGVRKQGQLKKAARLLLSLSNGGVFVVSDKPLSGHGWETEEHKNEEEFIRVELPMLMYEQSIIRRAWGGAWRVEQIPSVPRDRRLHMSPKNMYRDKREWDGLIRKVGGVEPINLSNAEEVANKVKDYEDREWAGRFGS